ncbi:MarR family winged helix-turn-helix transcriptional regulator [Cellulosimicrobium sp. NPDC057127]|uniref:MarR family winged helix-turn-helix transcriptional regulator n=1 Tax=Cellulosimicrobium sp. NPDC057127 TaxID=3346026 RepID=UPI00362D45BA
MPSTAVVPDGAPAVSPDPSPTAALVRALDDLARVQRETAGRLARELDLPRASFGVLRLLDRCGPVPLGDVASRLRVDLSVASRQVSHLVDAGLARRTVDDDDRRARTVELTADGRALLRRAHDLIEAMSAATFADWSADELTAATAHIDRVAAAVASSHDPGAASGRTASTPLSRTEPVLRGAPTA